MLAFVRQGAPGLTVVDDWSGFGQRTTASGTVIVENVRVAFEIFHTQRSYDRPTFAPVRADHDRRDRPRYCARALEDTIAFVQQHARPWIDSGVESASEDPLTVAQIGDIAYRVHAAEALLARSGRFVDAAKREPSEETVAQAAIAVGEAKIATTEVSLLAASKLFEPAAASRRSRNTTSTATGATRACIRCTTRCAGSITRSVTTTSTA